MCQAVLKVGFVVIVAIGTAATIVSMFTPGWQQSKDGKGPNIGIISYNCGSESNSANADDCKEWWNNKASWEKAVVAFMILALLFEMVILAWAILSCFAFCYPSLFVPLPFLCGLVTVFLVIAISIYGAKNHDTIANMSRQDQVNDMDHVGYSFWVGVFALIVMALATLTGCAVSVYMKMVPA